MTTWRERTLRAEGVKVKGGLRRRIALTMEDTLFFELRRQAAAEGRPISEIAVRHIRKSVWGRPGERPAA